MDALDHPAHHGMSRNPHRWGLLRWPIHRPRTLHVAVDSGSGPTVVLLHGIAASSATFTNLYPLLAAHHRVIAIDLLGFGKSAPDIDIDYSLDDHVAALARTIARLRLRDGFVLAGHSLGALIAVRFTATRRSRVERLILISPPIYPPVESMSSPVDRASETARLDAYRMLRENRQATLDLARGLERMPSIKDILKLGDDNWDAFELSLANGIERQTTIDDIRATTLPIDIVVGTADPFILAAGIRMAAQFPNVRVRRVAGADHLLRKNTAAVVAQLIDATTGRID